MKILKKIKTLAFLLLISNLLHGQIKSDVIAEVGGNYISVDEYRNRFEFMPHMNYQTLDFDTLKKNFLYSLIAEKLWSLESAKKRFDTIDVFQSSMKTLEKLFVKDELFREHVESKINLTADDILFGVKNINRTILCKVLIIHDSLKLFSDFSNINFDSLWLMQDEKVKTIQPLKINIGSLEDEAVERMIFELQDNKIAKPFKSESKWFLVKKISEVIDTSKKTTTEMDRQKVITILSDRRRKNIGQRFIDDLLIGKSVVADKVLFEIFSNNLLKVLSQRTLTKEDSLYGILLNELDLKKVIKMLNRKQLHSALFELDGEKVSLKDFIYYLIYQKVTFPSIEKIALQKVISAALKNFIEHEIIVAQAYREKMNELSSVKNDMKLWSDYYLSELILQTYRDSINVSENEVMEFLNSSYKKNAKVVQANIIEILTHDLSVVEEVLNKIHNGEDFRQLAKVYNQREYTKQSGGEWGYFPVDFAGEIGKIASQLNVGEVYGPLQLKEGYSIIKLIDKKEIVDSAYQIDDEQKEFTRIKISLSKMNKLINKGTKRLAEKYGIKINQKLLQEIKLSEVNSFTYRYIGFGGKIAALPITIPLFEWYKEFKLQKVIP